ncbi:ferric reductase-like transmembrane domain-containing protein [Bosea sp. NBC_00550]|uniref:ferric reductase-like transmembrane domain-containing protein n=1 Tax=Bosea sp. NBC_00550 TaxID=2969621 RepID=UPI00222EF5EF|nr:ferric reductase-like transmembrane domain-containing protein [Bosea sp. NBC_00550]UZF90775.1 ferric reductase-like transmembrane domain-containing protein [Bosea sp. NBC_00550]
MGRAGVDGRRIAAWIVVVGIAAAPVIAAAANPLQGGREMLWIMGGMAGVVALCLLFVQPLLMAAAPPLLAAREGVHWHRWGGIAIVAVVALHVGALYAYSPDDMTDALLLVAPTPFSLYGVISLWCLVLMAVLVATRRLLRFGYRLWRILHSVLAVAVVGAGAIHAIQIEGVMEEYSKLSVCIAALAATTVGALEVNVLAPLRRRRILQSI